MSSRKPLDYLKQIEQIETELTQLNASRSLTAVPRNLEVTQRGNCTLLKDISGQSSAYYNRIKGFGPEDVPHLHSLMSQYKPIVPSIDMTPNHMTEEVTSALITQGMFPVEQLVFMVIHPVKADLAKNRTSHLIKRVTEANAEQMIEWIQLSHKNMTVTGEMITRAKPYFYSPNFINYLMTMEGKPCGNGISLSEWGGGIYRERFHIPRFPRQRLPISAAEAKVSRC
ncbi:hypothetical protein [Paenibacillus qinlingensis]|uniref:Uncharacterized protein n=1 Tax=Paenibacillus qinlingensis TaxID=1837343 RepID=A0ABU1NYP5_9BACL|nr:hypothetical protein [Paenibacillus qinlingensis]MDR6552419.1 hypothetical protein [Paenibacillus qinlingensis]